MSFLQVGSWNIEHLSGASRKEKRQSAFALADHIEMAGIDILALQEIYVTDADAEIRLGDGQPIIPSRARSAEAGTPGWRNSDLDVVCHLLEEHRQGTWAYLILPNRDAGDRSQLCAVMWNTDRLAQTKLTKLPVAHKVDGHALWDRAPHAVTFTHTMAVFRKNRAGAWQEVEEHKSFAVVPLHMKSNYGGGTKSRLTRHKEALQLLAAIEAADLDPSLILIGDTNILKYDEPAIEAFVTNGFVDLNNTDSGTYWSRDYGDSPFDRAFVREGRPEFKYTRQYVLRSADLVLHDRLLSDHYMIKMSVKLYLDDADPRPGLPDPALEAVA